MLEPRQMNEDGLGVREANHRMMNMLAILLALFHRNFSTHEFGARSNRIASVKVGFSRTRSAAKAPIGDAAADFCPPAVPALVRGARPSDEQRRRRHHFRDLTAHV
jgi:hypothetical protein